MPNEQKVNIKKFYQNSAKPRNYVPNALVTSSPDYPPVMSGLMQINPETKDIWISAGRELVSDWINITSGGGGTPLGISRNGVPVSAAAAILNFVGASSVTGDPVVTVTIPVGPRIFRSGGPGQAVDTLDVNTTTFSVLIPANTVTAESVVRITYRVRMLSTPISETWTQPNITVNGSEPKPFPFFTIGYDRMINASGAGAKTSQMTRTIAVNKNGVSLVMENKNFYTDDNVQKSPTESALSIDWTKNQYIVFGIEHKLQAAEAQGALYLIEIF